ncbi:MAG: hypothetical protein DMG28_04380 [Acidobacteria bacterium]|nr:MAG: hypothetical protein DMG28_04380 [Acidobacteriota bacterium]
MIRILRDNHLNPFGAVPSLGEWKTWPAGQKNDRCDAELLLESLLGGDFPAVDVPCLKGAVLESGPSFPILPEAR